MGWSDLPPDLVISIASRLPEADDYARFRSVCKSWESSSRGFRPTFFPWLAVIRGNRDPNKGELSFISHASNGRIYKRHVRSPNVDFYQWHFNSNKQGWLVFVLDDGVPIIVNPVTGAQLQHPLPSIYTLRHHECRGCCRKHFDFCIFLVGLVAFATCYVDDGIDDRYHILAVAMPGDEGWSTVRLAEPYFQNGIHSIVFHEADRKYYAMHHDGDMQSFSLLTRCCGAGSKTDFGKVSILAKATSQMDLLATSHLLSDGTNLLQVKKRRTTMDFEIFGVKKRGWNMDFEILKYCPDADMWVQVIDMENYLGNNALFFDRYGVRLLPLPLIQDRKKEEERFKRNCIYFTHYDEIIPPHLPKKRKGSYDSYQYVHYVKIYDVGEGTVEHCFNTNIQSNHHLLPAFMWFTPSLSINN